MRSTIDGELGLLDVALGQSITPGQTIGQVKDLSDFKIEAQIDEHYIDRIKVGLSATFERDGKAYDLLVRKVYPEDIRISRQNPLYYEVEEGLEPGERVITSGYEVFKDNEILKLK